jgi:poly(A) polymerase
MQPRFERASGKAVWRMLDQPRFRAAVDFLQLRAEAHEVDSVQAQWWMDLADADDGQRAEMIESHMQQSRQQRSATGPARKRRRPRRKTAGQGEGDRTAQGGENPQGQG